MDERLRHVEEAQSRYEKARVADRDRTDTAMRKVEGRLSGIEAAQNRSAGGWRIAAIFAGFGVPIIISFLAYIARQVS
jgi:hypothetical protein